MKTHTIKSRVKRVSSKKLQKQTVKKGRIKKKPLLAEDPFFSSSPVDLGRTNNTIIDQILYGYEKQGA